MAVALAGSAFGATVSSAPRCLLVNEDNDHFFKLPSSWMDRAGLLRYLDEVLQGPVTHFVMCVNGQRTSYASETWEPIWTGIGEPARKDTATHPDGTHDRWAVNAKRLFDQGIDPYEVWIGECRKRGVEAWVSMRMNDYHFADVTNYFRNTTFCRTRRDLWVEQSPKTWAGHALDYAKKEVRDYSLRQIREMCRRWDADGIELDWMRSPPHFRKGAGRANAAVLTAFMREVRAETERVGKARNRKYKLAVRVPPTPGESSETGIDVATWLREGLVDAIVPSNLFCPDPTLPVGEWADLVREANPSVELYPCVNCFHHASAASIRASAAAYLGARVDGIYLFNAPYVGKRDTDGRKHKEDSFGKICREGLFPVRASVETADAVIVGSTPAGISAAVQLARWPEASYAEREEIAAAHRRYQQGLLWTLANHPRVPRGVRDLVSKWGLAKDEFADSDHWPRQIYVREARRMVGEYVMTEHACRGTRRCPRPVACGAYQMDSHHCRRYVGADGFVHNEGDVQDGRDGALEPYGIDYLALVPKSGECANLLVPVCLSASHIAYGSLRMEPVFFALGQAAGTAAALALDAGCAMQDVDYEALRARLAADGQVLPKR